MNWHTICLTDAGNTYNFTSKTKKLTDLFCLSQTFTISNQLPMPVCIPACSESVPEPPANGHKRQSQGKPLFTKKIPSDTTKTVSSSLIAKGLSKKNNFLGISCLHSSQVWHVPRLWLHTHCCLLQNRNVWQDRKQHSSFSFWAARKRIGN